ncbi:MAG: HD domain-containing protein [Tissierellia bacterium]|nr:HD domain-containing protein [Tissierellia bacterium]
MITRETALELLKKYNKEEFHLRHAFTVEGVMKYFAKELGYEDNVDYWAMVGLLHDVDFGTYPDEHLKNTPLILKEAGVGDDMINSILSHGYGICSDVEPVHQMEKILYATDELTGLIWSASLMRPSKSVQDMELKSIKKKFKDKKFAAGCDRDVIANGAEKLDWTLDELLEKTLEAMKASEEEVNNQL